MITRSIPLSALELSAAMRDALPYDANRLDRVLRIEDRREGIIMPRPMMMAARSAEATTPIEPGLIEIQAHVTLTVSIK